MSGLASGVGAQVDAGRAREPVTRFDGQRVVRVEVKSARDLQTVSALTDDIWTESIRRGQPVDVRVTQEQFAGIMASGLRYRVLIPDLQAEIDRETAEVRAHAAGDDPAWYTNYHNYTDTKAYVQALAAAYPTLATYVVLGQSFQGRDMFAIRITGPGSVANRPAGLWWGGQHAREWITEPVTEYCAEQLLTRYATDPHVQYLVNNVEFVFVPIMNPDGYDFTWTTNRLWRKNRHTNTTTGCTSASGQGVDLNRNWGYGWGIAGPATSGSCTAETYYGPAAFSEPETQVMRNYIQSNPRLKLTLDWHSYGQLVMSPWGYTADPVTPPELAAEFQSMDDRMASAILGVHAMTYDAGPIYTTIYPASGTSVDWAFGAQGIHAFTIELRDHNTFQLSATQITPTCEENWAAFLVMADSIAPCYANCDGSTTAPVLNVADFTCFLQKYASADPTANCDGSTDAPVLNVADFTCFLQKYAAGCP